MIVVTRKVIYTLELVNQGQNFVRLSRVYNVVLSPKIPKIAKNK
jgi:hypothetical protein